MSSPRQVAVVIVFMVMALAYPHVAEAHCPGDTPDPDWRAYAASHQSVSGTPLASGIKATIQWTDPNPCTTGRGDAFSAETVTLCQQGACDGFVQVGWVKRQGYSAPKYYCEFEGDPSLGNHYVLLEGTIPSASSYEYKFVAVPGDQDWECFIGGTLKHARSYAWMGWQSGSYMPIAGETNATHAQIGKNYSNKLLIYSMNYLKASTWIGMNVILSSVGSPYGVDEPNVGQFRNWTFAH